ncbi:hypothetical protein C7M84_009065 [Penaeus vannamei]|uniref:Uncharacterized protein n=1 Tax=Penaeus vannamei TaxID=6689 RepID=A0A3R7P134_PENVA|nr:hypothetical protein C7M84_009065 [Penaeus vannamei]
MAECMTKERRFNPEITRLPYFFSLFSSLSLHLSFPLSFFSLIPSLAPSFPLISPFPYLSSSLASHFPYSSLFPSLLHSPPLPPSFLLLPLIPSSRSTISSRLFPPLFSLFPPPSTHPLSPSLFPPLPPSLPPLPKPLLSLDHFLFFFPLSLPSFSPPSTHPLSPSLFSPTPLPSPPLSSIISSSFSPLSSLFPFPLPLIPSFPLLFLTPSLPPSFLPRHPNPPLSSIISSPPFSPSLSPLPPLCLHRPSEGKQTSRSKKQDSIKHKQASAQSPLFKKRPLFSLHPHGTSFSPSSSSSSSSSSLLGQPPRPPPPPLRIFSYAAPSLSLPSSSYPPLSPPLPLLSPTSPLFFFFLHPSFLSSSPSSSLSPSPPPPPRLVFHSLDQSPTHFELQNTSYKASHFHNPPPLCLPLSSISLSWSIFLLDSFSNLSLFLTYFSVSLSLLLPQPLSLTLIFLSPPLFFLSSSTPFSSSSSPFPSPPFLFSPPFSSSPFPFPLPPFLFLSFSSSSSPLPPFLHLSLSPFLFHPTPLFPPPFSPHSNFNQTCSEYILFG